MSDSTGVLVRACDDDLFTKPEALALTGFLAGYSGLTRDAYSLDLRLYTEWVTAAGMRLFDVRRAHIEAFARTPRSHRPRPSDDRSTVGNDRLLLPVRGTGRPDRALTRS